MSELYSSIIDNRHDNTLLSGLSRMGEQGRELLIASAFFSLDALFLLADAIADFTDIRILFGDDASPSQRKELLEKLRTASDTDLLAQRKNSPLLSSLQKVEQLFANGYVQARCYTKEKFHAKAYLITRPTIHPAQMGVIGSGNFTRPGLLQNIELNVELTPEQTSQLRAWYDERWDEAEEDIVTEDILKEIQRHITLYDPYYLYLKALYLWGQHYQGDTTDRDSDLLKILDKHQQDGVFQSLKILQREHGVLISDGVGLGKSFIALALMEHYCQQGERALLIAPKNILENSWFGYLKKYLGDYDGGYGNIKKLSMTDFGFDPEHCTDEGKCKRARDLARQADVIVIDESHNFRTTAANRYVNLFKIIEPVNGRRKKVIMLTATPINTSYSDISAQLALITHNDGRIGGFSIEQIRKATRILDKEEDSVDNTGFLTVQPAHTSNNVLNQVLEQVMIQRSRETCKALSTAAGEQLRFPTRLGPECIEYQIQPESANYSTLIKRAHELFRPGVKYVEDVKKALEKMKDTGRVDLPASLKKGPQKGIKLAAFLTEQYRRELQQSSKQYSDEVHLAGLVFANALKQLESSPAAFQGIIQSIGVGLIARLKHVFGDQANNYTAGHEQWVRASLCDEDNSDDTPDTIVDGDTLDASGAEVDQWLDQAIRSRKLGAKLAGFTEEHFDVERWRDDIVQDLRFLKEVHAAILDARKQPDPKLKVVVPKIEEKLKQANRILVFTQSQRTAEYLEAELKNRLPDYNVARIDSRVEKTRAAIVHAFCPGYNPPKTAPSVPARIDVLISTDVLSEGVNLQEAGVILNYDIHWNPVRLIQRIGRVDRRLDPKVTPHQHEFIIYNVLPCSEIEEIIRLVESVERRTLKISKAIGIDESFFKSTDPEGTLKEFNKIYNGEVTPKDHAFTQYIRHFNEPDEKTMAVLDALPPGAFGIWDNAPCDGLFALFTMQPTNRATDSVRNAFATIIGRPVLALERAGGGITLQAAEILNILSKTIEGEPSALPSDEAALGEALKRLENAVRSSFFEIALPNTILPSLVCWMELRRGNR
ncbi:MAG: helicase-related protein [Armatimonadota bacterium]